MMIDRVQRYRPVVVLLIGASLAAACAGGATRAPVVERSTGSSQGQSVARTSAGTEAVEGDWTATVRPLGDPGTTRSRALASDPVPAAAQDGGATAAAAPQAAGGASTAVNPAVVSLLNTASAQSNAGDHARAAATLERAISIEPNNPWLWHRLAATRLAEGRLEQAAGLAAKSSALPGADRELQADNWKLIAEVRRRQGNSSAAAAAESKAAALAN